MDKKVEKITVETCNNLMQLLKAVKKGERLVLALYVAKRIVLNDRKALLSEAVRREVLARNKAKDRSEFRGFSKAISILRKMAGEGE